MEHIKSTIGTVVQEYKDGNCVHQEFSASDQVEYLGPNGVINPPENEVYQPFDMVQPNQKEELDYYVVMMWNCVEPQLYGPYFTPEKQQIEFDRLRTEYGEDNHTFFMINITKSSKLKFDYSER